MTERHREYREAFLALYALGQEALDAAPAEGRRRAGSLLMELERAEP